MVKNVYNDDIPCVSTMYCK